MVAHSPPEEEEQRLLSGVAQVHSRLFEGRVVERVQQQENKDVAAEWHALQRQARERKERIVVVDG